MESLRLTSEVAAVVGPISLPLRNFLRERDQPESGKICSKNLVYEETGSKKYERDCSRCCGVLPRSILQD